MALRRTDPEAYRKAVDAYNDRVRAYNAAPRVSQITLNRRGTSWETEHPLTFAHELGHHLDFQGRASRMKAAARRLSAAGQMRGRTDLSAITDPEERLIAVCRETRAYESLSKSRDPEWTAYARDPVELWARAYSQWAMESIGDPDTVAALRAYQGKSDQVQYQWSDEEFDDIAPLVEGVLTKWGLMEPTP